MSINYFLVDNLEYMSTIPDNFYDLAIADPEQAKGQHGGKFYSAGQIQKNGKKTFVKGTFHKKKKWDKSLPSDKYFSELFRISKHQIIWGCQYYDTNFGPGRIIWDKVNDGAHQYSCELAYNSLNDRTEIFRYMWGGMMQGKSMGEGYVQKGNKALNEKKIHPTQKPTALYQWIFYDFKIPLKWKIFDPNLGSGSIGIVCDKMGYSLDACENDLDYFNEAGLWLKSERVKNNTNQYNLFKTKNPD